MDVVAEMERAFAIATGVLEGVQPDQWDAPSPCEGWTVRDVVNHMVGGAKIVSLELSGRADNENYYVNHLRGLDPVETYRSAAADAVEVFRSDPGLVERTIPMPLGPRDRCDGGDHVHGRSLRGTRGMSQRQPAKAPTSTPSSRWP